MSRHIKTYQDTFYYALGHFYDTPSIAVEKLEQFPMESYSLLLDKLILLYHPKPWTNAA